MPGGGPDAPVLGAGRLCRRAGGIVPAGGRCPARRVPGRRRADLAPVERRRNGRRGPGTLNRHGHPAGIGRAGAQRGATAHRLRAGTDRPIDPQRGPRGRRSTGCGDLVIERPQVRRQRPAAAQALVHGPLLDSLRFRDRADRAIPHDSTRQPEYRRVDDHRDFLSNLGLPRSILADTIRRDCLPARRRNRGRACPGTVLQSLLSEKFSNRAWIERF